MPEYSFYCKPCNLKFKQKLGMGEHPTHKCKACKGGATRVLEGFGFGFAVTAATQKANSGVTKHDYPTADNIVGRSADDRWQQISARNQVKNKFREETGAVALSRRDVVEKGQVVTEYKPLTAAHFDARKKQEAVFKAKADKDGIQQPSQAMPVKRRRQK